jgi:hypothetical protein
MTRKSLTQMAISRTPRSTIKFLYVTNVDGFWDNPEHHQIVRCGGDKERRVRRMKNTPQGGATEGNTADDTLMVDQGAPVFLTFDTPFYKAYKNS